MEPWRMDASSSAAERTRAESCTADSTSSRTCTESSPAFALRRIQAGAAATDELPITKRSLPGIGGCPGSGPARASGTSPCTPGDCLPYNRRLSEGTAGRPLEPAEALFCDAPAPPCIELARWVALATCRLCAAGGAQALAALKRGPAGKVPSLCSSSDDELSDPSLCQNASSGLCVSSSSSYGTSSSIFASGPAGRRCSSSVSHHMWSGKRGAPFARAAGGGGCCTWLSWSQRSIQLRSPWNTSAAAG